MFQMALDNSLLMEIYPYGGLWAYLKYHFIDGVSKQSIMLLDKTRVDYDSKGDKKKEIVIKKEESEDDFNKRLRRYGFGAGMTNEQRAEQISEQLEKE